MQVKQHRIKVNLDNSFKNQELSEAVNAASSHGVPNSLLSRSFLYLESTIPNSFEPSTLESEGISLKGLSPKDPIFIYSTGLRFSLPSSLFKKYNFLTSKMYSDLIPLEKFESYIYFVIRNLFSGESHYDFLEDEIASIDEQIRITGTFTGSNNKLSNMPASYGTMSEHLIFSAFAAEIEEKGFQKLSVKELSSIRSIVTHVPALAQLAARNPQISEPSKRYSKDWNNFVAAGVEIIKMVSMVYIQLKKDYWKTYTFFVNNDFFEIASIFCFSDIDEEAVDNWTSLPKSVVGSQKSSITLDALNYLKWGSISRY